jgi:hypothetical protein
MLIGWPSLLAQDSLLNEQVTAVREAMANNKAALSEYTWKEEETIAIKDKVWREQRFQVQLSPDGGLQRISLGLPEESASAEKANRGLRDWMAEKNEHAMMSYARDLKQLAETYTQPDADLLRVAYEQGHVTSVAGPDVVRLLIHNYLKPGDFVAMVFDLKNKEMQTLQASSYLIDAKAVVIIDAKFSTIPGGPTHIDEIKVVARKKNLTLSMRNFEYQEISPEK